MHYLIIPGIQGSDDAHWQTLWQNAWGPAASRISPSSWDYPDLDDWCRALDQATRERSQRDVVIVAHSLGCLASAHWLRHSRPGIRGALLVAPPDPAGTNFPAAAAPSFTSNSPAMIQVPSLVISSDDDPYCSKTAAHALAADWAAGQVSIGPAGHINSASGLGTWDLGRALLRAFISGIGRPA